MSFRQKVPQLDVRRQDVVDTRAKSVTGSSVSVLPRSDQRPAHVSRPPLCIQLADPHLLQTCSANTEWHAAHSNFASVNLQRVRCYTVPARKLQHRTNTNFEQLLRLSMAVISSARPSTATFDLKQARADTPGTQHVVHFNNAGA